MSHYRSLLGLVVCLTAACATAFAGNPTVTPEPKLGILVVLGVGAAVLGVRKLKDR
jgi:hypothetical protein